MKPETLIGGPLDGFTIAVKESDQVYTALPPLVHRSITYRRRPQDGRFVFLQYES